MRHTAQILDPLDAKKPTGVLLLTLLKWSGFLPDQREVVYTPSVRSVAASLSPALVSESSLPARYREFLHIGI